MTASMWLPTGDLDTWGLTVAREPMEDAGTFTGGGWKICWHTTEGVGMAGNLNVLDAKRAAPHFVLDPKNGRVTQCIAMDRAARALAHPSGPDTNRANVIQVELIGFSTIAEARRVGAPESRAVPNFGADEYRRIASLACLIEHRHPVARHARPFRKPTKFVGDGFVTFSGHCGHVHVPGNDHVDPGVDFDWPVLLDQMVSVDH